MTVLEAIQSRRSIRRYSSRPVEPEALERVLEAGRLAPSARNQQTWHFTVVRDSALRQQLMAACREQPQVGQAPVTLVIWSDVDRKMDCGQSAATVDCSIALSFMMLQATAEGLGTCWLGAFSAPEVQRVLSLPATATVVAVTPLGYPEEAPEARPRKTAAEVIDLRP